MTAATKFQTIVSPEADAAIDTLGPDVLEPTLTFLAVTLPDITRRDAVSKGTTPFGTIFTFQVPETPVIVTCLNGHNQNGERLMIVVGLGVVA